MLKVSGWFFEPVNNSAPNIQDAQAGDKYQGSVCSAGVNVVSQIAEANGLSTPHFVLNEFNGYNYTAIRQSKEDK